MTTNNIPKIIHYCWFGNSPKTKLVKKCIASWQKYLPEYEIREWNNADILNCNNQYVQEAYKAKKWAFISDYFRLYALYNYGGIYFDTDNEVFKSFDEFLHLDFFSGYENFNGLISPFTAVVGAKKGNSIIKDLLDEYNDLHFIKPNGEYDLCTNTTRITNYFKRKYNFIEPYDENKTKTLENNCIIFPSCIFCQYKESISYAVHHFNASWTKKKEAPLKKMIKKILRKIFSVYNEKLHEICCICGLKFKFRRKRK